MSKHKHDWRVDPRMIAASYPLQEHLVCAICGDEKWRPLAAERPSDNPSDWPKA